MKIFKNINIKVAIFTVLILIISAAFTNSYGYEMRSIAVPIEQLEQFPRESVWNPPDMLYRKQVGAFTDYIDRYTTITENRPYYYIDGWVYDYMYGDWEDKVYYLNATNYNNNVTTPSTWKSFHRIYEYFHPYQNSNYIKEYTTGSDARKYTVGDLKVDDEANIQNIAESTFYKIDNETQNYKGLYDFPSVNDSATNLKTDFYNKNDILILSNNIYRWFIYNNKVLISDNILTNDMIDKLREKYGDMIYNKQLTIYNSSVARFNYSYHKGYSNYVDTAYKFYYTVWSKPYNSSYKWYGSPTIQGTPKESSFVNYYDNTIEIPIEDVSKKIYVRHVDVTGLSEINSTNISSRVIKNELVVKNGTGTNGRAIKMIGWLDDKPIFGDYIRSNFDASNTTHGNYTDYYEMKVDRSYNYIFGNIKYESSDFVDNNGNSISASYLDDESRTEKEKKILNNYNCVGCVVGKGATLSEAEASRDSTINNGGIEYRNGNYASENISTGDINEYIVIDFYYREREVDPKKVYVRHINLTDYNGEVTKSNVDRAIASNKVLSGINKARISPFNTENWINASALTANGYQEIFELPVDRNLRVYPSSKEDYICIGTNMTSSKINISDAKNNMESYRLSYNLYNSYNGYCETISSDDYILVDFYYKEKDDSGLLIQRPRVGRLSFYTLEESPISDNTENTKTLSGDSSTDGNINNYVANNSKIVYDVIPSGETLKLSVDNAYVYMLGAINIQEKSSKGTEYLDYTIIQPYTVEYKNWYGTCNSCGASYTNKTTSSCSNKVEDGIDDKGNTKYKTCGGSISNNYTWSSANGFTNKVFRYSIPYNVTYYKVKNMRIYTISKIELLDGYSNLGLPLFDGNTHIVYPTQAYKDIFTNSKFTESSIFSSLVYNQTSNEGDTSRSSYKLPELKLRYYNETGDVGSSDTPLSQAKTKIESIINTNLKKHSDAATITEFITNDNLITSESATNGSIKINTSGKYNTDESNPLIAKITLTNDNIYIDDTIADKDIYIIGENVNKENISRKDYETEKYKTEKESIIRINLSKYTATTSRTGSGTSSDPYKYDSGVQTVNTSTVYPKSIRGGSKDVEGSKYLPDDNLTDRKYFAEYPLNIPISRLNGKRYSYGRIYYSLLTNNNNLNFDVSNTAADFTWSRTTVDGIGTTEFYDTEMYNTDGSNSPTVTTKVTPNSLNDIVWEYGKNDGANKDVDVVDVFTPIKFTTKILKNETEDDRYVDHTIENKNNEIKQIQKNSQFTIQMKTGINSQYDELSTTKYLKEYYIKFDFDVQDIWLYDAKAPSGRKYISGSVSAGTWIGPIYNLYNNRKADDGIVKISAYALADANYASNVVNQETNEYVVRAVAYNTPSSLVSASYRGLLTISRLKATKYNQLITDDQNEFLGVDSDNQYHQEYYEQSNIKGQNNYIAEITIKTENIGRVYDFKVTDLLDIDWKNIFRQSTSTTTNKHTSKAYYSGVYKWNTYITQTNEMNERDVSEIGATKQQILPLGPYKNINSTYTKAPKLGYKFSFDLKTTGANTNKKVVIEPKFYYISKDAKTYIDSSRIKLFYKNSSNKYVDIKNYNLYFVPNDGYRLTFEETDQAYRFSPSADFSNSSVKLGNTTKLTLNSKMMQKADNSFIQIWYGEYKLPNSTIAVEVNNNKYDINKPLTDGYIGVVFDIKVYEYKEGATQIEDNITRILRYSQPNNNYNGTNTNTSQWDYEGYLGFRKSDLGSNVNNLTISLEKGIWKIKYQTYQDAKNAFDNGSETSIRAAYEDIKGTVILYDTDAKASSDYN